MKRVYEKKVLCELCLPCGIPLSRTSCGGFHQGVSAVQLFFPVWPAADEMQMQMENELSPSPFDIKY
jgi:hypothetical protein